MALALESDGAGGAEFMLLSLAEELRDRGWRVCPVGPVDGCGWLGHRLRERGFETETFTLRRPVDLRCVRSLADTFRRRRVDVIHSHEFSMGVYGAAAAEIVGLPHVITMHGTDYFTGALRRKLALGWACRRSRATVAVSRATRRRLVDALHMDAENVSVIRNGIRPQRGTPGAFRVEVGAGAEEPILLAVGNLYPVKGHDVLVRSLAHLNRENPARPWIAAVAGRGGEEERLRDMIREEGLGGRVRLLGFRDDIPDLLAAADVFVMPSRSEGLPLALLEAMHEGKVIVATRVGGVPEAVSDGREALLVPPEDPPALAGAIRRVLEDRELGDRLGRAARERARREFSVEIMADGYEAAYRGALAPGSIARPTAARIAATL